MHSALGWGWGFVVWDERCRERHSWAMGLVSAGHVSLLSSCPCFAEEEEEKKGKEKTEPAYSAAGRTPDTRAPGATTAESAWLGGGPITVRM
ncbi:hypothetical protein AAFF_G00389130 [Aldrovandia affinis]|uniref:Uncharacterized protein n=1 Tax=Aldrovandia affinis TaxID=143900 RepID=A0AAD7SGD4_9TELE|nr:hypothetical protein AAFF_G00389130 [Aldrovandia affinis]